MRGNPFNLTDTMADVVGVLLIILVAIGVGVMMWVDYRKFLHEHIHRHFRLSEFIKREHIFIVLFLLFLFLIGGELLLYNSM